MPEQPVQVEFVQTLSVRGVGVGVLLAALAGLAVSAEPSHPAAAASMSTNLPYDEAADARADLNRALQRAASEHKEVLVVFGANWCTDCRSLSSTMNSDSPLARHIAERYVVTKVDVGRFDKNTDLAGQMDNPIQKGIPAVAVLRGDGTLVKATSGGELADARQMGDAEVLAVLQGLEAARESNRRKTLHRTRRTRPET